LIHSKGGTPTVFILGDPERYEGAAKLNFEMVSLAPIEVSRLESIGQLEPYGLEFDGLVDAIFGTGLTREVSGLHREVIEWINVSGKPVFSVDIPSGVEGDTGRVLGAAVQADHTVTFGLPKIGNLLYPGYELGGELSVSSISFPPEMIDEAGLMVETNDAIPLPPRSRTAHKGDLGDALFVAGASSYLGAPYFAAMSFLRAGGGYARLAAPRGITPFIAGKGSEIVFAPQEETPAGSLALANKGELLELAERVDMVVLGPGMSLDAEAQELGRELAAAIEKPLVIDGDGITAVCQDLGCVRERPGETILTPHLGEMCRITGLSLEEIDDDKVGVVQRTARDLYATVVLKGAHSLIGTRDGKVYINLSGNPGMATAGSGDVLTGTIAAMYGLGLPVEEAARKGVFIHGLAGDLAARDKGEDGITAQDVLDYLPQAMKLEREGLPEELRRMYAGARVV
jgi:hydroxyethylthiazole kinase-like uncharacterized protein yjeF